VKRERQLDLGKTMTRYKFAKLAGLSACALALLLAGTAPRPALAQAPEPGIFGPAPTPPDSNKQRIIDLVVANHILAAQGVLDGFGHVSVRSLSNPKHYFMARSRAPAIVNSDDIIEFDENSQPVNGKGREMYNERYIHGEIFRMRPDLQAVVHSHSAAVLPFTVTGVPLKAMIHVAYFLGTEPSPVFDLADVDGPRNGMLVINATSGAALAKVMGNRSVALMRGHGFAAGGENVRDAVFKAIYTQINAETEADALSLGTPTFMNKFEVTRTERVSRQWELWVADAEQR